MRAFNKASVEASFPCWYHHNTAITVTDHQGASLAYKHNDPNLENVTALKNTQGKDLLLLQNVQECFKLITLVMIPLYISGKRTAGHHTVVYIHILYCKKSRIAWHQKI